jgi:pilus assembly protein Flp/PilA
LSKQAEAITTKTILDEGEREMKTLVRFLRDEEGVSAIEYGLIAALVAVAIITILKTAGTSLQQIFQKVATELQTAAS